MSLHDKLRCQRCTHPQSEHRGTHVKGSKAACCARMSRGIRCSCIQFKAPPAPAGKV